MPNVYGSDVLSIVLTGMGFDGADGSQTVRDAGGRIIAQDQASSVVYGMPKAVADRGLADEVLSLDAIGKYLENLFVAK